MGLGFAALLLCGCAKTQDSCLFTEAPGGGAAETAAGTAASDTEEETVLIYVDVCGEVENPGVYRLSEGSRVYEAVALAGGMTPEAAAEAVNQASVLLDGQQLRIPSSEEWEADGAAGLTARETDSGLVNLNGATAEELMTLPGIGESKAADIIAYRESAGPFLRIEDIMNVSGIKEAVFNRIKDRITV